MSQSIDIYLKYCAMKAHFGKGDYDYVKFVVNQKCPENHSGKEKIEYFLYH